MEELSKHTPTELLKMINDCTSEHEKIKKEIVNLTYQVDELQLQINAKIEDLTVIEKNYVDLIEELNSRENGQE